MSPASPNPPAATLLVIEDDDIDAQLIARAFDRQPLEVHIRRAVDGEEALEILRDPEEGPDGALVILLDLNLPRMTGLEFLDELRGDPRFFATPVFVFSTSSNPEEIREAYQRFVVAFLVKPVSTGHLDSITELLTTWLRLTRLPSR